METRERPVTRLTPSVYRVTGLTTALRGMALAGLAVAGVGILAALTVAYLLRGLIGLVFAPPTAVSLLRRLANLRRRLAGRWSDVDIPRPYAEPPAPPVAGPDGLYQFESHLYKKPNWPAYWGRAEWQVHDRQTGRDMLWVALDPVVGLVLGLAVVLAAPFGASARCATLRLHGRWTAWLLGPAQRPSIRPWRPGVMARLFEALVVRATTLAALSAFNVALVALILLSLGLTFALGLVFMLPIGVHAVRSTANLRRHLAGQWSNVDIPEPYRPEPAAPVRRPDGMYEHERQLYKSPRLPRFSRRLDWLTRDPATWRDLLWLLVDPFVGTLTVGVPVLAAAAGFATIGGRIAAWFGGPTGPFWGEIAGSTSAALPVGVALIVFGLLSAQYGVRLHGKWTQVLLAPTREAVLARRVDELTESRADATDSQAAEVRRIERDLHDGAQARLIAIGLTLSTIERLLERDPAAARVLLAQARETSTAALNDLRDLVRGIHPPVLAERGLPDAVRALALDSALAVQVDADLPGRPPAPVESAAYFAIAEAIANAAKHARATGVQVELRHAAGVLRVRVEDDGRGGADDQRGSGLRGIRRRLGTFDGVLTISSPAGGPTTLTMEVPCALYSPKTSTS
jgi:signal transduction histidine kinase